MVEEAKKDLKLFYCYARQDKKLLSELDKHLTALKRRLQITSWYDGEIIPGKPWEKEIKANLDTANVILLLISADFLASNYCYSIEMQRSLERHSSGEACVIPVLIRPVYWEDEPFSELQMLPSDALPITRWPNRDEAFEDVTRGISKSIKKWLADPKTNTSFDSGESQANLSRVGSKESQTNLSRVESKASQAILPHGTYQHNLASYEPGCFIVLLDQSASMAAPFGESHTDRRQQKSDIVVNNLSSFLDELIITNIIPRPDGTLDVRPRADIAILGYGGSSVYSTLGGTLGKKDFVTLPELQMNPLDIGFRKRKEMDDTGQEYEFDVPFPIWVRPMVGGDGTPMCAALETAKKLATKWVANHQTSFPPVVINITGGPPTDGDPTELAHELCRVSTRDGQTLLFNCYISDLGVQPKAYPASEFELPHDPITRLLFSISSIIPRPNRYELASLLGVDLSLDARGFILNGEVTSIRLMFNFASKPGYQPLDPNR